VLTAAVVHEVGAPDVQRAAGAHRVDGVSDQIVHDLSHIAFHAWEGLLGAVAAFDLDAGVRQTPCVQGKNRLYKVRGGEMSRFPWTAVKAQRLGRDVGDACNLMFRRLQVAVPSLTILLVPSQIEEIRDGLKRVIDLVRNGRGEATDGSELVILAKRRLRSFLCRDLQRGSSDALDFALRREDGEVVHRPGTLLSRTLRKFPFQQSIHHRLPGCNLLKQLVEAFDGSYLRDGAAQNLFLGFADDLRLSVVETEKTEVLWVEIGEANGCCTVEHLHLGILLFQQRAALSELLFRPPQLRKIGHEGGKILATIQIGNQSGTNQNGNTATVARDVFLVVCRA